MSFRSSLQSHSVWETLYLVLKPQHAPGLHEDQIQEGPEKQG